MGADGVTLDHPDQVGDALRAATSSGRCTVLADARPGAGRALPQGRAPQAGSPAGEVSRLRGEEPGCYFFALLRFPTNRPIGVPVLANRLDSKAFSIFSQAASSVLNPGIEAWRSQGGKVIGYFCAAMPAEMITAAGMLPFRLRATGSRSTELSDSFLQPQLLLPPSRLQHGPSGRLRLRRRPGDVQQLRPHPPRLRSLDPPAGHPLCEDPESAQESRAEPRSIGSEANWPTSARTAGALRVEITARGCARQSSSTMKRDGC